MEKITVVRPATYNKRSSCFDRKNFKNISIRLPLGVYKKLCSFTLDRNYRFHEFLVDLVCVIGQKSPEELCDFTNSVIYEKYFKE